MQRTLLVLGLLSIAACGSSSTSPEQKLVVTLSGPATVQGRDTTESGAALYYCDFQLTAKASGGTAGEVATWGNSHYTYTQTSDGYTYTGSDPAPRYFDGDSEIETGTEETQGHIASWLGPFSLALVLYYSTLQGTSDSATYSFSCL